MAASGSIGASPGFARHVDALRTAQVRPEVTLLEVPAPTRLAPFGVVLSAEVAPPGKEHVGGGRLAVLHDPDGQEGWQGTTRMVAYAYADVDLVMAADPMLPAVGWEWLVEALHDHGASYTAAGGTVTRTASSRFGELAQSAATMGEHPDETAEIELRASWTPTDEDLVPHLQAFCELLCSVAGLPPAGVALLGSAE